jgi:hypothetical protein
MKCYIVSTKYPRRFGRCRDCKVYMAHTAKGLCNYCGDRPFYTGRGLFGVKDLYYLRKPRNSGTMVWPFAVAARTQKQATGEPSGPLGS